MTSSTPFPSRKPVNRALALTAVTALIAGGVLGLVAPAHALTDVTVSGAEIGSTYAGAGETVWLKDGSNGGTGSIDAVPFDSRPAFKLELPNVNSVSNLFRSFGQGVRPTDIPSLLENASYSYTGFNVNFQLGVFYTPADSTYGPPGTGTVGSTCTQATDNSVVRPGMCFTILKFETGQTSDGAYTTITLGDKQAPYNGASNPGWWNTARVGQYASKSLVTLDQMLAEMSDYEVYAVGVSIGNSAGSGGDPHDPAWLLNLRFGENSYSFGPAPTPATPVAPPAADTEELEELIADEAIDLAAQTGQFVTTGSENTDLTAIDGSLPLNGIYEDWEDPTDAFVDVYSYSAAVHLGVHPIVDGNVVVSNLDLSHLAPGPHYLLLQGQTSGIIRLVQFSVLPLQSSADDDELPPTGDGPPLVALAAAVLLLSAGSVLLYSRRRVV